MDNIAVNLSRLALAKRFFHWRTLYPPKPISIPLPLRTPKSYHSENIEEEDKGEHLNNNVSTREIANMFNAEITKSGAQLAQILHANGGGMRPGPKIREEALKGKIREICIEMMNDIISKYVSYKHQLLKS